MRPPARYAQRLRRFGEPRIDVLDRSQKRDGGNRDQVMQQSQDEGEEHSIELELLNENTGIIQACHTTTIHKAFI